jgi:hypothetical protein
MDNTNNPGANKLLDASNSPFLKDMYGRQNVMTSATLAIKEAESSTAAAAAGNTNTVEQEQPPGGKNNHHNNRGGGGGPGGGKV